MFLYPSPRFASPLPQFEWNWEGGIYFAKIGCQQRYVLLAPYFCDYQRESARMPLSRCPGTGVPGVLFCPKSK